MTTIGYEQAAMDRKVALLTALDGCKIHKPFNHSSGVHRTIKVRETKDKKHFSARTWRMCEKKNGYTTRRACERVIAEAMKLRYVKLRYYLCDRCGKYHITKLMRGMEDEE